MGVKIAITGEMRSGKDTVCDYIKEIKGLHFFPMRFAEGIEIIINEFFPEAVEGDNKPRKHYQDIGQKLREVNPDVWVNYLAENMEVAKHVYGMGNFIVTDLRQPNEYEWLKNNGFTVIKVEASKDVRIQRMKESGDNFNMEDLEHETEVNIRNLPHDFLINNDGTLEELKQQTDEVMKEILGVGGQTDGT